MSYPAKDLYRPSVDSYPVLSSTVMQRVVLSLRAIGLAVAMPEPRVTSTTISCSFPLMSLLAHYERCWTTSGPFVRPLWEHIIAYFQDHRYRRWRPRSSSRLASRNGTAPAPDTRPAPILPAVMTQRRSHHARESECSRHPRTTHPELGPSSVYLMMVVSRDRAAVVLSKYPLCA